MAPPTPPLPMLATEAIRRCKLKRVRWNQVTVYEFPVAHGGSAVPLSGGPAIGLGTSPTQTWTAPVGCSVSAGPKKAQRMTTLERTQLLQDAGFDDVYIDKCCRQTRRILRSRKFNSKKAERARELRRLEKALVVAIEDDLVQHWHGDVDDDGDDRVTDDRKRKLQVVCIEADEAVLRPSPKTPKIDRLALLYDMFASDSQSSIVVL
ncbi:hypothetical protein ACHHYP_05233 [Achlya hypogyna]|uniref:Uncharacterized protein n=1 Tax=Achlya hypogyna TaxID=1202772 RepID=A0A1V9YYK8_ACHHY|nr:hypothetical protein ACHHYP_05233 [Achlya hypogyna]